MKHVFKDTKNKNEIASKIRATGLIAVAIVGSKSLTGSNVKEFVKEKFLQFLSEKNISLQNVVLVSGGAKGIDTIAEQIADELGIDIYVIKPNYKEYYPKAAPLKRNETIALSSDYLLAFKNFGSKSSGTMHVYNYFKKYRSYANAKMFYYKEENKKVA